MRKAVFIDRDALWAAAEAWSTPETLCPMTARWRPEGVARSCYLLGAFTNQPDIPRAWLRKGNSWSNFPRKASMKCASAPSAFRRLPVQEAEHLHA